MSRLFGVATAGLLLLAAPAAAQTPPADTTAADTLRPPVESPSGVDTIITYSASDSLVYSLSTRTLRLFGGGKIAYRSLGLTAERIAVDWTTATLTAEGVPDTADTAGGGIRGRPELLDGGEVYHGSTVAYNFRSKKGKIGLGRTEIDASRYYGTKIKKVTEEDMFVEEGKYTSCELDHPHYYFGSPEMKVTVGDEIVARPVYFYVSDVPVFALPFGIFPNRRGRRSGLLAPAYGQNNRGRYLTKLGYYWAMTDYTDLAMRTDLYTNGSWVLYGDLRYVVRYLLNGSVTGSYGRTFTGERGDPDFREENVFNIRFGHRQEFDPTMRLDVDFTFSSGSYYQQTSNDLGDLLRQNIVSNATLNKAWEGTPNSMSINIRRDQVIAGALNGELSEVLPSVSFSRGQTYPFRSSGDGAAGAGQSWYELIGYTYGGQFSRNRTRTKNADESFTRTERLGMTHGLGVNASFKAGYVTLTPFANAASKWYPRRIRKEFNPADSSLAVLEERGFYTVSTFDVGLTAGTKLYGILQPGILGITGIRHQLLPSVSYTYQPDFSRPAWGYYGRYGNAAGQEVPYSRYEQEIFGGAPAEERQAISFRLSNIFEMKTARRDTAGQENKFQLLNLDISGGYNFARDSLKFDEIGMGYRTAIGDILNIGGSARFNLYAFEPFAERPSNGRRVNRLLLGSEGRLWDMTSFQISLSTALRGEQQETSSGPALTEEDSLRRAKQGSTTIVYDEKPPDFSIPWNVQLSWNFSQSQFDPRVVTRSSVVGVALGFNLTPAWKIDASMSYDILQRTVAAPLIRVYRDLHCWEMTFDWAPTGFNRYFQFAIRLKAPQLQDVKVTKQRSGRDIF